MKNMKKFLFVTCIFIVTVAFYGCRSDKEKSKDDVENKADIVSSVEPAQGGSVVVGITQDLDSLDPHKAVAAGTREVMFNIYEGLYKPNEDGDMNPAIASSYTMNKEGTVYEFTLREGIVFHNGKEVTVNDVIYSIKRVAGLLEKNEADIRQIAPLKNIKKVDKKDNNKIEVTLKEPDTELIYSLGAGEMAIIPEEMDNIEQKPIGTGPFIFESYSPLESMVIKKNEHYWNTKDMPYLDEVTFKIFSSSDAAFMQVQAGSVDILAYLTDEQAKQLVSSNCEVKEGTMNLVQALFLNNAKEPFNNKKVRQAISYAVDRQGVIDMVADGKGSIIGSNMTQGLSAYYNEELNNYYNTDLEKAKQLLKEAGYENGLEFRITVPSNYQFHVDTAQVIVEQLKQIGITAKINLIDWSAWLSDVYTDRDYQATIIGVDGNLSPSSFTERFQSDAGNNFINYKNSEYDDILALAVSDINEDVKITHYKELQELLTEDAASVYLEDPALLIAVNKKLGGYQCYPVYVQDMSSVYWIDE